MTSTLTSRLLLLGAIVISAGCVRQMPEPEAPVASGDPVTILVEPRQPRIDAGAGIGLARDDGLAGLLSSIVPARIRAIDSALVSFGTRHTMSDTLSPTRGIGAARRWIHRELASYADDCNGCLRVEYDPAMMTIDRHPQKPSVNIVNVLAWLPGRDARRVIVMGGHYDSCVCSTDRWDATSDAPGADDDGSGSAAVIELARVFAQRYPEGLEATVIFALYAGEELGLLGSRHLAERLEREGYEIVAAMTDDIVGNIVADDGTVDSSSVRVFAGEPDNGPSRELARYIWALGALYQPGFEVVPVFRLDRIGRGGDHIPFHERRAPAVRFSERLENYKRQHLPTDRLEDVNFPYVARVARLNAATIGGLGLAPPPPDSVQLRRDRASGGQYWQLRWEPVDGAASYEVLVRRTTSATYDRIIPVGNATSYVLREQLDDAWAAVRSVGASGHRSLTVVVPSPSFVSR